MDAAVLNSIDDIVPESKSNSLRSNLRYLEMIPVKSLNSRYKIISELGSGSFGIVSLYKIRDGMLNNILDDLQNMKGTLLNPLSLNLKYSNDLVAIKTMNKKLKNMSDYSKVKEIKFIFSVDSHFNLVQIIDIFIDRTYLKLNIVMENMDQNLYQLMKMRKGNIFSPRTLKSVLSQLLSAILHIHKHMFFHRDVKPENILVMQNLNYFGSRQNIPPNQRKNSYIIKLADYGLARNIQNDKPFTSYVSTRWYRSPEILLRQGFYSYPIDIWAFGCVAIECATFCPIFPGANELDQCCKIMDFLGNPDKNFQLNVLQNSNQNFINNYNYYYNPYVPFGGFWDDAKNLASKLGLKFPKTFGRRLEHLTIRRDFQPQDKSNFFNMVKSCLTWDPNQRISAYKLTMLPYFEDSINLMDNSQKENHITIPENINKSNIHKSMLFAGIDYTKNFNIEKPNNIKISNTLVTKPQFVQPGLGINNKLNIVNTSNLLKNFKILNDNSSNSNNNRNSNNNNSGKYNNHDNEYCDPQIILKQNNYNSKSELSYNYDTIDDYIKSYPMDISGNGDHIISNITLTQNNNNNESLILNEEYINQIDETRKEDDKTNRAKIKTGNKNHNKGQNENQNENINININTDMNGELYENFHNNGNNNKNGHVNLSNKLNYVENQDSPESLEPPSENDDNDEEEEKLLELEMNKISNFLSNPESHLKPSYPEVSIEQSNNKNHFDLIDEINFALDDEFNVKHTNLYPWNEEN